ncbi:MAG: Dyp-type peroxidase [Thiohalomonadaceae bacterium]
MDSCKQPYLRTEIIMPTPQSAILALDGPAGLFLILHLKPGADDAVRRAAGAFPALLEEISSIAPEAQLVGTLAFGAEQWDRLSKTRPKLLKPFAPLDGGTLRAPATGGDLLLHLHSARADLNYLLANRFVTPLRPWIERAEETPAFRYLDARDLTGFIDGTENPQEQEERREVALIGDEDSAFAGGSYIIAQRYVHHLERWNTMPPQEQEGIIGRSKPDSVELDDAVKPPTAHIARVVIEEDGEELEIVRHSLPYGVASGESGLFFLACSRDLTIYDKMLRNMFGLSGDGLHDRLMEFTEAVSGSYFFAPSVERLRTL